ncbi:plasminogen-like [Mytilus edulis]|uniref:plasminogen-like n=1 Tax=Mytilus edulis TaxID=6550 RepID=UPI0039EE7B1A
MTYTDYISWLIFFCEMKGSHCNMESSPLLGQQDCGESNMAVEGDDSCLSIKPVPRYSQSIGSIIRFDCEARSNTMSEAKFHGYCPLQVCQLNGTWSTASLSCAKNECIETGKHYNGRRVCTKSGIPCQSWTSQVPHSHGFVYGDVFPDKTIEHAGRTCRDPGFLRGSPWCYTQDNNIEWDFCDIPKCQGIKCIPYYAFV